MRLFLRFVMIVLICMPFATRILQGEEIIASANRLEAYNVIWDSPSKNEHGSMPIGNGDLAANVWIEPSGDLVFYISKSDAWSGNGRLLKLGRVRIKCDPAIIRPGMELKQTLDLEKGHILIHGKRKS